MLEQLGGPQGELAAAMRYFTQAISEDDPKRKDMLLDIATEELSHLEVIGSIVSMLCKGAHPEQQAPVDGGEGDATVMLSSQESELRAKAASRTVSKTRTRVDSRKIAVDEAAMTHSSEL